MAVTEHTWCDFVIWTESEKPGELDNIHVQRIYFDEHIWATTMLPALGHFIRRALVPELLTKRVKRLGKLYLNSQYVSFKKLQAGFYV